MKASYPSILALTSTGRFRFLFVYLVYSFISLFTNPYRVCRKFLERKKAQQVYAYGETPFTTYQKIISECGITGHDCWLELGAGRGVGCFWLASHIKCSVIGVEWIPQFVYLAKVIKHLFRFRNISFELKDISEADFSLASVVYLYLYEVRGCERMEQLPLGAQVITISEPLSLPFLTLKKSFAVQYPWGETEAFVHEKIAN